MHEVWVIVVAAGSGRRYGGAKQYELLAGRRVLDWSLDAARAVTGDGGGVVAVVTPAHAADDEPGADVVVAGAATRSGSVRAGLAVVPQGADVVVVHDGARPLAEPRLFQAVVDAVRAGADAAIPGTAVTDTLRARSGGLVDRDGLVAVQTPQAFRASALRAAHATDAESTDDASLVEAEGGKVVVVDGSPTNLKITRPADLAIAEALLRAR
ncbi:MAG: 2-C-methyl-D-erythritol 4-phosphate cytidylyltransferase [Acidimicrobiales bacterium]|nr:2-C-methyl-D-erythritol 4-phosphate cytidylyltransferase [Acidimicrobiales bacterium]